MRFVSIAPVVLTCLQLMAAPGAEESPASELIRMYLSMPHPADDRGVSRTKRLEVLTRLAKAQDALAEVRDTLPAVRNPEQRTELAEILGRHIQTAPSAEVLAGLLKDPDEHVRWMAVHGLRLMSARTSRTGAAREQHGSEHPPKVEGLVPVLVSAAHDSSVNVRVNALFALADARDPDATQEIRERLRDTDRAVRFQAACFLTEFQDGSGLPILKETLKRLLSLDPAREVSYYGDAAMLLASLERMTGKSFGQIPLHPGLSSFSDVEPLEVRYAELLRTWAEWWDWTPRKSP